jgi:hypothetical protein
MLSVRHFLFPNPDPYIFWAPPVHPFIIGLPVLPCNHLSLGCIFLVMGPSAHLECSMLYTQLRA